MRFTFNKANFLKEAQMNLYAPRFKELKSGNLGEWLLALLFIPTLGLFWYPIVFLGSINLSFSK